MAVQGPTNARTNDAEAKGDGSDETVQNIAAEDVSGLAM